MDRPGVRQVLEGSGEKGKMEKTGCKIICGAPTTFAVKGLMMMLRLIYLNYIDTCVYLFDHVLVFSSSSLHCGKLSIQSKKSTGWGGRGGG